MEFTEFDKIIARRVNQHTPYKYVARNEDGVLYLSKIKPHKYRNLPIWQTDGSRISDCLGDDIFLPVTWDDDEPTLVANIYSVLNESERHYLECVIEPFRDRVTAITKYYYKSDDCELIAIYYDDDRGYTTLPPYKIGTTYKGMERGKAYTVEELGLFK